MTPGEIVQLDAIAASRKVADDLRAEQTKILNDIVVLSSQDPLTAINILKCAKHVIRLGAISKALEKLGQ